MPKSLPLTERMQDTIDAMAALENAGDAPSSPNEIAGQMGFDHGMGGDGYARNGRRMAPAQRVIFPLIALRRRGLVVMRSRRDGLSGTAYSLSAKGWKASKVTSLYCHDCGHYHEGSCLCPECGKPEPCLGHAR